MTKPHLREPPPYFFRVGSVRTVEDVFAWQEAFCERGRWAIEPYDVVTEAREKVDADRRQACRYGALNRWRTLTIFVRGYERKKLEEGLISCSITEGLIEDALADALAYRHAARTRAIT